MTAETRKPDDREAVIQVRGLLSQFGERVIHQDLDLDVMRGEVLGVVGGSGTGKTVLLNSIIGLKEPEGGEVSLFGQDRSAMTKQEAAAVERRTGVLFQQGALFSSLTVLDNVASPLVEHTDLSRTTIRELAEMKVAMVGLKPEALYLKPAELSGGMRKRVGLARAIATQPEIIFFDEPTTGLDPIMADVINDLIIKCVKDLGATALSITHDMASARKIADRIAMIYKGKIIWSGPVSEIDNSGNPYVDQFIHGRADGPIQMEVMQP